MPSKNRRAATTRARRKARQRRQLTILGAALATVLIIIAVVLLLSSPKGDRSQPVSANASTPTPTPAPVQADEDASAPAEDEAQEAAPTATDEPEQAQIETTQTIAPQDTVAPEPTPVGTPAIVSRSAYDRASTRPTPTAPGFIPVFVRAKTEEKIIAITVDDCFQADNLQQIVDAARAVGGKLTIFPIGEQALRDAQSKILRQAWQDGFEIENHTYTHNGLYWCDDERMVKEIYYQQLALCQVLGVEYQPHFLRPGGGDARHDQRMQKYAEQLGYYGIAHWSCAGSTSTDEAIIKALKPGAIYLFHTTKNDLDKLLRFIPYAAKKGYQLVTLNEMFDYPDNEAPPLTTPINEHVMPTLAPFERVLVTYKKTSYSSGVQILQNKLIELGYLPQDAKVDGIYGNDCEAAIKAYQKDHGLEQDGIATAELQARIFAE